MTQSSDEKSARALRDVQRVNEQSERILGGGDIRPPEPDANDPIVIMGKRIARLFGVIAVIWLIYHLLSTYVYN